MQLQPGQALRPLKKPPITREHLMAYAEASGDKNPIHLDEDFARSAGLDGVIVHGMLSMAFIGDHVRFNFPEKGFRLLKLKTRFRKVTHPGDELTCEGTLGEVDESDGSFTLQLRVKNQHGELTADGTAQLIEIK